MFSYEDRLRAVQLYGTPDGRTLSGSTKGLGVTRKGSKHDGGGVKTRRFREFVCVPTEPEMGIQRSRLP